MSDHEIIYKIIMGIGMYVCRWVVVNQSEGDMSDFQSIRALEDILLHTSNFQVVLHP